MAIIRNVVEWQIKEALERTNKGFNGNVIFNRFEPKGKNFVVTLKVKSSKGYGARTGFTGRAMTSACWHVYGMFYQHIFEIFPGAVIVSNGEKITQCHGNWIDRNIGSIVQPLMYSDACHCKEQGIAVRNEVP
jgi:hypothetical protein